MTIRLHERDLPGPWSGTGAVAIDTETMGLNHFRDRLCLVQLSAGDGTADLVRIERGQREAPHLAALLADPDVVKIFHFARFDIAALVRTFGVMASPVFCTKIASRLSRTYTDRHGLKDLTREFLGVELSKQQQSSDWGAEELTEAQMRYAAQDVLYLHDLRDALTRRLEREGRMALATTCFGFLSTRVALDLSGWEEEDIFSHS